MRLPREEPEARATEPSLGDAFALRDALALGARLGGAPAFDAPLREAPDFDPLLGEALGFDPRAPLAFPPLRAPPVFARGLGGPLREPPRGGLI